MKCNWDKEHTTNLYEDYEWLQNCLIGKTKDYKFFPNIEMDKTSTRITLINSKLNHGRARETRNIDRHTLANVKRGAASIQAYTRRGWNTQRQVAALVQLFAPRHQHRALIDEIIAHDMREPLLYYCNAYVY